MKDGEETNFKTRIENVCDRRRAAATGDVSCETILGNVYRPKVVDPKSPPNVKIQNTHPLPLSVVSEAAVCYCLRILRFM
jgi:hypothetical protein